MIAEELGSLKAALAFDRDWMDLEHADLGKHAASAPVFAATALVLAALGLVAVIAHSVSQRTKEIGVGMAIGAATHDIARMIVREGMRPVAFGYSPASWPRPARIGFSSRSWLVSHPTIHGPWLQGRSL